MPLRLPWPARIAPWQLLSLALLAAVTSASAPRQRSATRIEYEGTLLYEGHGRRPGEVRPFLSRQVCSTDGRGAVRVDWTIGWQGDSLLVPETYLLSGGRVFHRGAPDQPWQESVGERARQGRFYASGGLPDELERVTRAEGLPRTQWRTTGGRLHGFLRLQAHNRLGDVRDSVSYTYRGKDRIPKAMTMASYHRDSNRRLTQRRVTWTAEPQPESLFALPASFEPAEPPEKAEDLDAVPPLVSVAEGIWSADLEDLDSRSLIVEFADHLAVIEMAVGSANGERIVDAARQRWPGKPIRFALFSHHHPHYAGGLRAFLAEGATVITTPGNEAFVRRVAARPFRTRPDRFARSPKPVRVRTFTERHVLEDRSNRLEAINYGERSQHTDEFVMFWFPRQKLLFEAENGWSGSPGGVRAGRRARALLAWIAEQGMDVERVVQCWPMLDAPALLTRVQLDSLVQVAR